MNIEKHESKINKKSNKFNFFDTYQHTPKTFKVYKLSSSLEPYLNTSHSRNLHNELTRITST